MKQSMVYIKGPASFQNNADNPKSQTAFIFLENIPVSSSHGLTSKTNIDFATGFGSKKRKLISQGSSSLFIKFFRIFRRI